MKKLLKPVILSAITLFAIGCSSDDNSNPGTEDTTSIVVIDKMTTHSYGTSTSNGIIQKPNLGTISNSVFNYDEYGKVISMAQTGKQEIGIDGGSDFSDKVDFKYDDKSRLIETTLVNLLTNEKQNPYKYEYTHPSNPNWVTKLTDTDDNEGDEMSYTYNDQGLVTKATRTTKNNQYDITFLYNANKNVSKSTTILTYHTIKEVISDFTYDDKKNPYANMNLNFTYGISEATYQLPFTLKTTNNIKTEKTNEGSSFDQVTDFEYNNDGYPTKATTYFTINKEFVSNFVTYTYKTIKIKK